MCLSLAVLLIRICLNQTRWGWKRRGRGTLWWCRRSRMLLKPTRTSQEGSGNVRNRRAQLLFAKSPRWATIKMDIVLFYRKVVVYSVSLISLLYVTAVYQRMLKLFIKSLLGNALFRWSIAVEVMSSVSGDINCLNRQVTLPEDCHKVSRTHQTNHYFPLNL